jgi:hypothetical protein
MLNLILTSLLQVGEAANPGNYPNNLSQESAFGIHIFPTTDLEVLFDFFFQALVLIWYSVYPYACFSLEEPLFRFF